MSKYTFELRELLESLTGREYMDADDVNAVIDETYTQIFNFPIIAPNFTADELTSLKKHILLHYYDFEIGFETFGKFKLKLNSLLRDIMPVYDERVKLLHKEIDFFNDYEVTRESETEGQSNNVGTNRNLFCDTPQGQIEFDDMTKSDYITNLTQDYRNDHADSEGTTTETTKGNFGNNAQKFDQYLKAIQNIELDIINDLRPLFMKLF